MEKGIKTLVFDLGGVLIDLSIQHYLDSFVKLGVTDMDNLTLYGNLKDLFRGYELGLVDTASFLEQCRTVCAPTATAHQVKEAWNHMLHTIPAHRLQKLRELHEEYPIFLLSNTNKLHWQYTVKTCLETGGHRVSDYFDRVFLSYEMHEYKPDLAIYRKMISDSGVIPGETLFLDDRQDNVQGAIAAGLQSIQVEPSHFSEDGRTITLPEHDWVQEIDSWLGRSTRSVSQ